MSEERARILVADDEGTARAIARAVLESAGFDVVEASDGLEAIAAFERHQPDLILLDVEMPGRDGLAVCRELRANPAARYVPIVMATGLDDIGSIEAAFAAGATDFIPKPINWALLRHRVQYDLRASAALREVGESEEKFRLITESSGDFIALLDREGRRLYSSPSYRRLFGTDLTGTDSFHEIHPDDRDEIKAIFRATVESGVGREGRYRWLLPDGSVRYLESRGNVIHDASGGVARVVVVSRDVTERTMQEQAVHHLAYYDTLTGLPNRRLFLETLATLTETWRGSGKLAVVLVDMRGFHVVNENLGRPAGDALLKAVSQRMRNNLSGADTLGRTGGDQFGLILQVPNEASIGSLLERILGVLRSPFAIDGEPVRLSVKAGLAVFPSATDGATAGELLTNAESALKKAKASPEAYHFYTPHLNAAIANRVALESALEQALEEGRFTLLYQPKTDLRTGTVAGLEALLYWNDPSGNLVSPGHFIPVLEDSGQILAVGRWVIGQAVADLRALKARGHEARIAVNVSPLQFRQRDFPAYLASAMGGPVDGLDIEITESVMMEDLDACVEILWRLREMGVQVALDDFGTGYSSLSYIARLPATLLKIDKSFVGGLTTNPGRRAIVSSVVSIAHALGMKVVAEGVETQEQARALRELRCDQMQGYLQGRPAPLAQMWRFFEVPVAP